MQYCRLFTLAIEEAGAGPCFMIQSLMRRMRLRIAQVAPLYESVPPKLYGGTERVVSWLTEELVGLGHEVTLFASGDSQTSGHLVPVCPTALGVIRTRGRRCPITFACWNWSFAICPGLM